MWEYYAFKIAGFTLAYFHKKIGYLIARLVADTVYVLSPVLRAAIVDNIRHVLGSEADDATVEQVARDVLRNTAKNYFDLIKVPHIKLNEIESCIKVCGWHNLEGALKKGKGVIVITAHLGSFDIHMQIFAVRSIKTIVLVESLEPPALLRHIIALREINGVACLPAQSGVVQALMQSLRRGEVVVVACDRDTAKNGLKSSFFGEEVTLPTTAVRLAMRTGAAVVPVLNLRQGAERYDTSFEPAINVIPAGNGAVAENIEQVARVMEKHIRSCPEQWVVLNRIWASAQ